MAMFWKRDCVTCFILCTLKKAHLTCGKCFCLGELFGGDTWGNCLGVLLGGIVLGCYLGELFGGCY